MTARSRSFGIVTAGMPVWKISGSFRGSPPSLNFGCGQQSGNKKSNMLQTLAIILIVAWLLGMVSSYTLGGFIHILLVVAIVLILVRLIQGKRIT